MKGIIIINSFGIPEGNLYQAKRLKDEFEQLGVSVEIVKNGWQKSYIENGKLINNFNGIDFAVFLDKDKYLSKELEKLKVKLFNSHNSIRVCDDKAETYLALLNNEVNMPDTIFAPLCYRENCEIKDEDINFIIEKLHLPLIVKESYGSLGNNVYKANNFEELKSIMQKVKMKPHLYQKYLGACKGVDIRIIVIGQKAYACMKRENKNDFRSNIACGGKGFAYEPSEKFIDLAEKVSRILNLDYCGVDLLFGDDGSPYVCEVNSNAFIKGIEEATHKNIAKKYAEYIIDTMNKK